MNDQEFLEAIFGKRMGIGEFYKPREGNAVDASTSVARTWFLVTLRDEAPQVMESLSKDVLPAYSKLCERRGDRQFSLPWPDAYILKKDLAKPEDLQLPPKTQKQYSDWLASTAVQRKLTAGEYAIDQFGDAWKERQPELALLQMALLRWSQVFRLEADWILEEAIRAIDYYLTDQQRPENARLCHDLGHHWGRPVNWQGNPIHSEEAEFQFEGADSIWQINSLEEDAEVARQWGYPGETRRRFVFRHDGWNPVFERWDLVEADLRLTFETALKDFRRDLESWIQKRGYVRSPLKTQHQHFLILLKRLTQGLTLSELSDFFQSSQKAIESALQSTSRLLQMEIPPFPPGPRRKKP